MNRALTALLAVAATTGASVVLRSRHDETGRWTRANYRGREVDLRGGIGVAAGALTGAVATGGRVGAAATLVTATSGVLGALDDADTESESKGLRGHLTALRRGEVTTGALKLIGISSAAVAAAAIASDLGARGRVQPPGWGARAADLLVSGVLIAGTANLVNLFDLRPGRALKLVGALALPVAVAGPGAALGTAALGVVAAGGQDDLSEVTMLGDAGANALGALVGTGLALVPSARFRGAVTAAVVSLVLASERISFSRVIADNPILARVDAWGRSE